MNIDSRCKIAVVVQGDVEQSPRMLAHVDCLLAAGHAVTLVGFGGSASQPDLPPVDRLELIPAAFTRRLAGLPRWLYLPLGAGRSAWNMLALYRVLRRVVREVDCVLVQAPPSVPLLSILHRLARRPATRVVVDWHNQAFAMLGLRLGRRSSPTRIIERLEGRSAGKAQAHLAVSEALVADLNARWGLTAVCLPDLPRWTMPDPVSEQQRPKVLNGILAALAGPDHDGRAWLEDPATLVAVCPTSWSLDEDMDMLLAVLAEWPEDGVPLLLLATGRGPARASFAEQAARRVGPRVRVFTGWLDYRQYRALLGLADVGLSLHRSASGLDFPMKIADMLATGVPVRAFDYGAALRDRLPPAPAADVFTTAAALSRQLLAFGPLEQRRIAGQAARRARDEDPHWRQSWHERWRATLPALLNGPEVR